jgi:aminoglycoside phosphotransferase (APT) family kinase protein
MKQPEKWRETMDPYSIHFTYFQLKEILGYPHAGNDVFYVNGIDEEGNLINCFLKVERQKTADIEREVRILKQLNLSITPKLVDYSMESPKYVLTKEIKGERLSTLVGTNDKLESMDYMANYGKLLAQIHELQMDCEPVKTRVFTIDHEFYHTNGFEYVEEYLLNTKRNDSYCFIHGDCHYANILWQDQVVTGLLDFELSGYGSREYDIAWALVLRPGQKFLKTREERDLFLNAYRQYHSIDLQTFNYYLVLFSMFFYRIAIRSNEVENLQDYLQIMNEVIAEENKNRNA